MVELQVKQEELKQDYANIENQEAEELNQKLEASVVNQQVDEIFEQKKDDYKAEIKAEVIKKTELEVHKKYKLVKDIMGKYVEKVEVPDQEPQPEQEKNNAENSIIREKFAANNDEFTKIEQQIKNKAYNDVNDIKTKYEKDKADLEEKYDADVKAINTKRDAQIKECQDKTNAANKEYRENVYYKIVSDANKEHSQSIKEVEETISKLKNIAGE